MSESKTSEAGGRAGLILPDIGLALLAGALTWAVYFTVEVGLLNLGPVILGKPGDATDEHLLSLGLIASAYCATGGVMTAAVALLLIGFRRWPLKPRQLLALSALALVASLVGNLLWVSEMSAPAWVALFFAGLVATSALPVAIGHTTERAWFCANPYVSSVLLVTSPFLAVSIEEGDRHVPSVTALAVSCVGAGVWYWRRYLWDSTRSDVSLRRLTSTVVATLLVVMGALAVLGRPQSVALPIGGSGRTAGQPDVVLIVWDTVRRDHLSVYGYERDTTPALRELVREATVYRRAIAPADMTLPSHASLFSGLYPRWHGAYCSEEAPRGRPISDRPILLAEHLSRSGYVTAAASANHYVSPDFGLDRGFSWFRRGVRINSFPRTTEFTLRPLLRRVARTVWPEADYDRVTYSARELTDVASSVLDDAARQNAPFFLFLNYMDAHIPYSPPAPYGKLFPGRRSNLLPIEKFIEIRHDFLSGERELQEEERKHFVSQYDGSLAYIDANVDRVIKKLKELGRYENSLLIITSDHGEAFGEKGLLEHQVGTYENTTGVPLIIKYPAQTDGSEVSFPVSLVDVPTTVLDVAGLEPAQETDGRSLLEFPRGHRRPVFAELLACATTRDIDSRFAREEQAVVSQGWKLIRSDKMTSELYYLDEDPGETNNLLPREDEIRRTLDQTLDDWLSSAPKLGSESVEVDRDLRDRLRSLGYL